MDWANLIGSRSQPRLARFRAEQDGSLTIFALMLFLLMVMMGGLAVDLMRYESTRTTLQNTLDRATLAAASLTQELDGEAVVTDYFAKAGLVEFLNSVDVSQGLNYREVEADASMATNPMFAKLIGIEKLDASGHSMAEQRITNVEIALVLDVSGSMDGTKLTNLKKAAKDFIDTVVSSDADDRISIAIVPYNAQVNLGAPLRQEFNFQFPNGIANVNCLEVPAALYDNTSENPVGLSISAAMSMSAFSDFSSSTSKVTSYIAPNDASFGVPNTGVPFCRPTAANIVRLPNNDITTLKLQIEGLVAESNTSIMAGMKWGITMLDPTLQPTLATLAAAGEMPTHFNNRPFAWEDPESMKLIILMTDGEHVSHTMVPNTYKGGASSIFRSTGDSKLSIRHLTGRPSAAGANEYFVPHLGTWAATPYNSGAGTVELDWAEVWATTRQSWVAWQLYARALGTTSTTRNSVYNSTFAAMNATTDAASLMNSQLLTTCAQAKGKGVIVYGIAFEAPSAGQTLIKSCSTSAAHFYNATGLQISSAFKSIANNISQLRLTQ